MPMKTETNNRNSTESWTKLRAVCSRLLSTQFNFSRTSPLGPNQGLRIRGSNWGEIPRGRGIEKVQKVLLRKSGLLQILIIVVFTAFSQFSDNLSNWKSLKELLASTPPGIHRVYILFGKFLKGFIKSINNSMCLYFCQNFSNLPRKYPYFWESTDFLKYSLIIFLAWGRTICGFRFSNLMPNLTWNLLCEGDNLTNSTYWEQVNIYLGGARRKDEELPV